MIKALRLDAAGRLPICTSSILINQAFAEIVPAFATHISAIYRLIEDRYGVMLDRVEQDIRAKPISAKAAAKLGVSRRIWAVQVVRRYLDAAGMLMVVSVNEHPGDSFFYSVQLQKNSRGRFEGCHSTEPCLPCPAGNLLLDARLTFQQLAIVFAQVGQAQVWKSGLLAIFYWRADIVLPSASCNSMARAAICDWAKASLRSRTGAQHRSRPFARSSHSFWVLVRKICARAALTGCWPGPFGPKAAAIRSGR